jgi:hypothetical protein
MGRGNSYQILVGKSHKEMPRRICEDNIKIGLRETGGKIEDGIEVLVIQDKVQWMDLCEQRR